MIPGVSRSSSAHEKPGRQGFYLLLKFFIDDS